MRASSPAKLLTSTLAALGLFFGLAQPARAAFNVGLSGFVETTRVTQNLDFNYKVNISGLANDVQYGLYVFGGGDQAANFIRPTSNISPQALCQAGRNLANGAGKGYVQFNTSDLYQDSLSGGTTANGYITMTGSFSEIGGNHLYAVLTAFPHGIAQETSPDSPDICAMSGVQSVAAATAFNVVANYAGTDNAGISFDVVSPQALPTGQNSATFTYRVGNFNEAGAVRVWYGKNEQTAWASDQAGCQATTFTGYETVTPNGTVYNSQTRSISFSSGASIRRIVLIAQSYGSVSDANQAPSKPDCTAVSRGMSLAAWNYDSSGHGSVQTGTGSQGSGGGTTGSGTTYKPVFTPLPGYVSTLLPTQTLNGAGSTGTVGDLSTGLCTAGDSLTFDAGTAGKISLASAGLVGMCNLNGIGQITRVLLIVAAFYFTFSIIMSGIGLFTATSDDALTKTKQSLVKSLTGAFLILFANWIVPLAIEIISQLIKRPT